MALEPGCVALPNNIIIARVLMSPFTEDMRPNHIFNGRGTSQTNDKFINKGCYVEKKIPDILFPRDWGPVLPESSKLRPPYIAIIVSPLPPFSPTNIQQEQLPPWMMLSSRRLPSL